MSRRQAKEHPYTMAQSNTETETETATETGTYTGMPSTPQQPSRSTGGGQSIDNIRHSVEDRLSNMIDSDTVRQTRAGMRELPVKAQEFMKEHRGDIEEAKSWIQQQKIIAQQLYSDLLKQPITNQVLMTAIMLVNLVIPLFYITKPEARAVLASYLAANILTHVIYSKTRRVDYRIAFAHIHWIPLISYLAQHSSRYDTATECVPREHVEVCLTFSFARSIYYTNWIRATILVNTITLLTDLKNIIDWYTTRSTRTTTINVAGGGSNGASTFNGTDSTSIEQDVHNHPRNNVQTDDLSPAGKRTRTGQYVKSQ
jgi:hypothetical protein